MSTDADRAGDAAKIAQASGESTKKLKRQAGLVLDGIADAAKFVKGAAQVVEAADQFKGSGSGSKRDCKSCFVLSLVFY